MRLGPVKAIRLGVFKQSDNTCRAGGQNIPLGGLPVRNDAGFGMLLKLEESWSMTFETLASDPTVPSYMLDAFVDSVLTSSDNTEWTNNLGFHKVIREYDRRGWLLDNAVPLDLPVTGGGGGGSYARTIVRSIDFVESGFGDLAHLRLLPCRYFATSGKLAVNVHEGPIFLNGATVTCTDWELTLTAYVADWIDMGRFPIAIFAQEKSIPGDNQRKPSPGEGAYLRWMLAQDPAGANAGASATPGDDLSEIEYVRVGPTNGPFVHDRYVAELIYKYMLSSRDHQKFATATALAYSEQFRFPDPINNTSGRLHYLPFLSPPKRGARLRDILDFGTSKPLAELNNGNGAGLAASYDHIVTQVNPRQDAMVVAILASIGAANRFLGDQRKHSGGQGRASMVPLSVSLL